MQKSTPSHAHMQAINFIVRRHFCTNLSNRRKKQWIHYVNKRATSAREQYWKNEICSKKIYYRLCTVCDYIWNNCLVWRKLKKYKSHLLMKTEYFFIVYKKIISVIFFLLEIRTGESNFCVRGSNIRENILIPFLSWNSSYSLLAISACIKYCPNDLMQVFF